MHFIINPIRQAGLAQNKHRPIISADADVQPNPRLESDGFTAYHLIEHGPFGVTGPVKLVCDQAQRFVPLDPSDFDMVCQPPEHFSGGPAYRRSRTIDRIANRPRSLYTYITGTSFKIEARTKELGFDPALQSALGNVWRRALADSYRQPTPADPITAMQILEGCKKIVYRQPPMSDRSERVGLLCIDDAGVVRARSLTWSDDGPEQGERKILQIGAHRFTGRIANLLEGAF